jgi:hypothetical protein
MMCALRAQTCAQPCTSSIGGQTAKRIGAQIVTNTHWNNGHKLWGSASAAPHIHHMRPNGWVDRGPNWYKHSFGQWEEVMGVGDRECALMRAERANMRTKPHIQHRRPNGWVDPGPHWYKHLLGQWSEVMGVGDRECALMRAQTCAQHHLASIGARRSGPTEPQIGTKTHWGNGHKLWGSACA